MLMTFIEECGFAASGQERSRGIPDLIALAHSSETASRSPQTQGERWPPHFCNEPTGTHSPSPATDAAIAAGPAKDVLPEQIGDTQSPAAHKLWKGRRGASVLSERTQFKPDRLLIGVRGTHIGAADDRQARSTTLSHLIGRDGSVRQNPYRFRMLRHRCENACSRVHLRFARAACDRPASATGSCLPA
jgi:hypothetical protein